MKTRTATTAGLAALAVLAGGVLATAEARTSAPGRRAAAPPATAADPVVLTAGDFSLTLSEVDRKAIPASIQHYDGVYQARLQAAEELLAEHLIAVEARRRNVGVEDLLKAEVDSKVKPIAEADVEAWYEANKNARNLANRPLESIAPTIRQFLMEEQAQGARAAFLAGLRKGAAAKVTIDPPRVPVEVASGNPSKGKADAPVQLVEFSDWTCGHCARTGPTMTRIRETYGDRVRLVHRNFPLRDSNVKTSEAALCANEQGKFWEYATKLFANQRAHAEDNLVTYAGEVDVDVDKFKTCLASGKYKDQVTADREHASSVGVRGTPAFFVNGRFLSGNQPFESFQRIIDEELERAGVAQPKG